LISRPDGRGFTKEHEEGGLKRILGIVLVQQPAADAPYHRGMPAAKGGERRLIPPLEEAREQLAIGQAGHRRLPGLTHRVTKLGHVVPSSSTL
jgi:hypothetical protein